MAKTTTRGKSGRPPKFRGSRRPITVTLPESTLARLASIDPARARAIVKATDTVMPFHAEPYKQVELVEVAPGLGIILVSPSQFLQKIKWLRLVEVAPMRFLLTIPSGTSVDSIEVAIADLLDDVKSYDEGEHSVLIELKNLLQRLRRRGQVSKAEMLFIDTQAHGCQN